MGIELQIDDKCIEDATLRDDKGEVIAVLEIKGVKGNFSRNHVNQIDSHRERLALAPTTPGILVVNTMMSAESLDDKDARPHPDIVFKAKADNVLLIRTLDVIRYANAVERKILTAKSFRTHLLESTGWLHVEVDGASVVE